MAKKRKADCTPEEWAAHLEYIRQWRLRNIEEQRERKRAYYQRPDVRAKRLAYNALPSTKARKSARDTSQEARAAARQRQSTEEAKLARRLAQKKRRTGFSEELILALIETQAGCCAICGSPFEDPSKIKSDHCHDTDTPRGLLCHSCNIIEGFMSKLPIGPEEFAKRMKAYLTNPPAQSVKLLAPPS